MLRMNIIAALTPWRMLPYSTKMKCTLSTKPQHAMVGDEKYVSLHFMGAEKYAAHE
jgi:hypothetical protein